MPIRIEQPGFASVQDAGRFGYERFGVPNAGAMDICALAQCNALVGQPTSAAAIEIGPAPFVLINEGRPVIAALAGATRHLSTSDRTIEVRQTFRLQSGERLEIGAPDAGVYSYLTVEGGFVLDDKLGSASVDIRARLGSPFPRALRSGDRLSYHPKRPVQPVSACLNESALETQNIRVVLGPQSDYFSPETIAQFLTRTWRISARCDRSAYNLDGPPLSHERGYNIVSDGVIPGSIQIPGSGQPLVLMADCGTTGGYPKIATVIKPDLGKLAQRTLSSDVRFSAISVEEAEAATRSFLSLIESMADHVTTPPLQGTHAPFSFLVGTNLAGDGVDALNVQC